MNKYLFVIARYKNDLQKIFEEHISPKNQAYCDRHGMEYIVVDHNYELPLFRGKITWMKFWLVDQWIKEGRLKDGDSLVHFDADMVVVKPEFEYKTDKSFSYAIDSCNSHCMGNYCLNLNDWSKKLVSDILDEELYQENKADKHWHFFREQAAWYTLAGIKPFCKISYFDQPHYGFHSAGMKSVYTLEELQRHVDVKTSIWDCTLLAEEIDNPRANLIAPAFINPVDKQDVIIRHFAARQPWRKEYL